MNFRKRIMRMKVYVTEFSTRITGSNMFENFIILIIGLNCITLAMSDSTKQETATEANIELAF